MGVAVNTNHRVLLVIVVLIGAVGAGVAQVDDEAWVDIPVINHDFRLPADPGGYYFYQIERYPVAEQEAIAWHPVGFSGVLPWDRGRSVGFAFNRASDAVNGLRQALGVPYAPGTYRLRVTVNANGPRGTASRVSLGYGEGAAFKPVGMSELDVPVESWPEWVEQELIVRVADGDEAIGRPIVVMLEAIGGSGSPDQDNYGTCWDTVALSYRK